MKKLSIASVRLLSACLFTSFAVGCSSAGMPTLDSQVSRYTQSGSILISKAIPIDRTIEKNLIESESAELMTPLIGFFPPTAAYVPAQNEIWMEIDSNSKVLKLIEGTKIITEVTGEGLVSSKPGSYFLQQKSHEPVWVATDEYFSNRKLAIPAKSSLVRHRKGALGKLAVFASKDFAIHSSPIWTKEVGGLKVPYKNLATIFKSLPLGAPIVVK